MAKARLAYLVKPKKVNGVEGEAIVEVKLFGTPDRSAAERFTAAATETVAKNLGISPDRVYVKYEGCTLWGVGGENF